ncbi:MAG: DNA polymerase IV [Spirochaetia bacterium]|nr:DNA polymerase IV [Spirochaetia bacterium]
MESIWFHVDMDAFYASVEQLDNPEYRNKPLIVGGVSNRGVVSACSYEARAYKVHSAMPIFMAKKLCPNGIYVPTRMSRYLEMSKKIFTILHSFSPTVQPLSIDEAFLDMSGTSRLFGIPREAGAKLKLKVYEETGLIISVGIGSNKLIAKLASDYDKPNGLCRVSKNKEIAFIDTISLGKIPGIGKVLLTDLNRHYITTTIQLREYSLEQLNKTFSETTSNFLYHVARAKDPGLYQQEAKSHSISNETTFPEDTTDSNLLKYYLLELSQKVVLRALDEKVHSSTVAIKIRYADFSYASSQITLSESLLSIDQVYQTALSLLLKKWDKKTSIRLIGVALQDVKKGEVSDQGELFDDENQKRRKVEKAILALQEKGSLLTKASTLEYRVEE